MDINKLLQKSQKVLRGAGNIAGALQSIDEGVVVTDDQMAAEFIKQVRILNKTLEKVNTTMLDLTEALDANTGMLDDDDEDET